MFCAQVCYIDLAVWRREPLNVQRRVRDAPHSPLQLKLSAMETVLQCRSNCCTMRAPLHADFLRPWRQCYNLQQIAIHWKRLSISDFFGLWRQSYNLRSSAVKWGRLSMLSFSSVEIVLQSAAYCCRIESASPYLSFPSMETVLQSHTKCCTMKSPLCCKK